MASKDKQPLRAVDNPEQGSRQDGTDSADSTDTSLRRKGIFLLPNVITTGALFAGFYAIIAAMNGDFLPAVLAIFIAMFLDTADGRVARITMSESAFGAQYDSLSDMVAFGVAPAVVAFSWGAFQSRTVRLGGDLRIHGLCGTAPCTIQYRKRQCQFHWSCQSVGGWPGDLQYMGGLIQRCGSTLISAGKRNGRGYRIGWIVDGLELQLLLTKNH